MKQTETLPASAAASSSAAPDVSSPLWYKDAVIYQVHVRGFFDSNDDGIGDFVGLTRKLDYIQSLGVSAIWLQPFYPSPLKDDGYDIADYENVNPSYGTKRDFRHFLEQAHARGLRVITELVINHTSDQHPWFQAARKARPDSSKRNFYVWSQTDQRYAGTRIIFTDTERSNWTWDQSAGAYYWHRFFHHQPDLNFDNPQVVKAVKRVMRFWFDQGVDGMRLDAVPYLIEREGTNCENLAETHAVLRDLRRDLDERYRDRMFLAEANQWPADVRAYFGEGDECHMAFNFPLMPRLFMALRQEDRHPIAEIINQTPEIPESCQWAIFLRNHDELTLEMVTDEERDYMYQAYAADPQMRLNVGIRRRLAPLMENSRPRIELLTGLLLSLPGTPILYYGDELGMGDNIYLGDRNGVRTPMQWNADRNAGFSRADPARLYAPLIMDSVYGYQSVNVEAQERSPFELLHWMRRLIALRQQYRIFGRGSIEVLRPENRRVFSYIRQYETDDPIVVVANLARSMQAVSLDLSRFNGLVPVEMSGNTELPRITETPYFLTLGPYGFYWLRLTREPPSPVTARPLQGSTEPDLDRSPMLLGPDWTQVLAGSTRQLLERRYLAPFFLRQRWFGRRSAPVEHVRILDWGPIEGGTEPILLTVVAVRTTRGEEDRYCVPLVMASGARAEELERQAPSAIVARIAGARKGVVVGHVDARAATLLLDLIARGGEIPLKTGRAAALRTAVFDEARGVGDLTPATAALEQSNSSILFGERLILKVVRRLYPGLNPELELGRFLTEEARFPRVPKLAGAIEYKVDGELATIAVMHERVPHQTDGWRHALNVLERYLEPAQTWDPSPALEPPPAGLWTAQIPEQARATVGAYIKTAANLGRRTAELHLALSGPEAERTLGTSVLDAPAIASLEAAIISEAERMVRELEQTRSLLPEGVLPLVDALLARRETVSGAVRLAASQVPEGLQTTRIHGDYHLGQVLLHEEDFTIVDLEGEPSRSIEERRHLQSPFKDIAGMVRSFGYAAGVALAARQQLVAHDAARLNAWARWWQTWTTVSFLHAYRTTAAASPFLPQDAGALESALRLFLLEKVIYEVRYELSHRPTWLHVPLGDLLELVGGSDAVPGASEPAPGPTGG